MYDCLIDTGAARSLLRLPIFLELCSKVNRIPIIANVDYNLVSISGDCLQVIGKSEIKFDNMPPLSFDIVKDLPHDVILGYENLQRGKGIISIPDRKLYWFNQVWPICCQTDFALAGIAQTVIETGNERINQICSTHAIVFSDSLGDCKIEPLQIRTVGPPVSQRPYKVPLSKRPDLDKHIDDLLSLGIIRPSKSPYASPVTLVPKGNSTRLVVDFRQLNKSLVKDKYPIPEIQTIFDSLGGGNAFFTTMDLKSGYHQIRISEDSIHRSAITTPRGLFEFTRIPFGLSSSGPHFQRAMNHIFRDFIGKFMFVYIDDLIIFSKTYEDYLKHIDLVLARLKQFDLRVKPSKCNFAKPQVKLLGYIVSKEGIATDPDKVKAIVELPVPRTVKQVRSFVGTCNYYRQVVPQFAKIAQPLTVLTRKHAKFVWGEAQQQAFDKLKQMLVSSHVMAHPDPNKPYLLYTDASQTCIGAILCQADESGTEKVIQYISHQLNSAQCKMATVEQEAYAIVYALQKLRHYLLGAKFTIFTDHRPLLSFFKKKMVNTKLQRWALMLEEFGPDIKYLKGLKNTRADMLSRIEHRPNKTQEIAVIEATTPSQQPELPEEAEVNWEVLPTALDNLDLAVIKEQQKIEFPDLYQAALAGEGEDDYTLIDHILYSTRTPHILSPSHPRLVLPSQWHQQIVQRAHKELGHMGAEKTLFRVREAYIWPHMRRDIKAIVAQCTTCIVHNSKRDKVPIGTMPLASYPHQIIGCDLVGPFVTSSAGNKYILCIICHATGWAEAYPLPDKTNNSVWQAFARQYIPSHGVPEQLICDLGMEFNAHAFKEYLAALGIKQVNSTPSRPQSNGLCERFNRSLKTMLSKACQNAPGDWEDHLADVLYAHRISVSSTTGFSPFFLLYGRRPRAPLKFLVHDNRGSHPLDNNRLMDMSYAWQIAQQNTAESRRLNRERINQKANAGNLAIGDTVIVQALEPLTFTSKWDPQYEIIAISGSTCTVRHQQTGQVKKLHREKVKLVDPNLPWDTLPARPKRMRNRPNTHEKTNTNSEPNPGYSSNNKRNLRNLANKNSEVGEKGANNKIKNAQGGNADPVHIKSFGPRFNSKDTKTRPKFSQKNTEDKKVEMLRNVSLNQKSTSNITQASTSHIQTVNPPKSLAGGESNPPPHTSHAKQGQEMAPHDSQESLNNKADTTNFKSNIKHAGGQGNLRPSHPIIPPPSGFGTLPTNQGQMSNQEPNINTNSRPSTHTYNTRGVRRSYLF